MLSSLFRKSINPVVIVRQFSFYSQYGELVNPEWVNKRLGSIKVLDTTRHLSPKAFAKQEFTQKHLPGAQFLDLDCVCTKEGFLIKKLPTPEMFQETMESLGISSSDDIVLYDSQGIYSSARAWFMFRVFNKNVKVHIMNGGLVRWQTERFPVVFEDVDPPAKRGVFELDTDYSLVVSLDDMKQRVTDYRSGLLKRTVIDCRRICCYNGKCRVPIAKVPHGNIPGSINIPFNYLTDPYNNYMIRCPSELRTIFEKNGVFTNEPEKMIFSCDYGISSCVGLFAMRLLGRPLEGNCAVYDGSWLEYAVQKDTLKNNR